MNKKNFNTLLASFVKEINGWSTEIYDPDECMFSGSEFVDGTIEGAMRAGMKAYPV